MPHKQPAAPAQDDEQAALDREDFGLRHDRLLRAIEDRQKREATVKSLTQELARARSALKRAIDVEREIVFIERRKHGGK